jgi:hypothetical protein
VQLTAPYGLAQQGGNAVGGYLQDRVLLDHLQQDQLHLAPAEQGHYQVLQSVDAAQQVGYVDLGGQDVLQSQQLILTHQTQQLVAQHQHQQQQQRYVVIQHSSAPPAPQVYHVADSSGAQQHQAQGQQRTWASLLVGALPQQQQQQQQQQPPPQPQQYVLMSVQGDAGQQQQQQQQQQDEWQQVQRPSRRSGTVMRPGYAGSSASATSQPGYQQEPQQQPHPQQQLYRQAYVPHAYMPQPYAAAVAAPPPHYVGAPQQQPHHHHHQLAPPPADQQQPGVRRQASDRLMAEAQRSAWDPLTQKLRCRACGKALPSYATLAQHLHSRHHGINSPDANFITLQQQQQQLHHHHHQDQQQQQQLYAQDLDDGASFPALGQAPAEGPRQARQHQAPPQHPQQQQQQQQTSARFKRPLTLADMRRQPGGQGPGRPGSASGASMASSRRGPAAAPPHLQPRLATVRSLGQPLQGGRAGLLQPVRGRRAAKALPGAGSGKKRLTHLKHIILKEKADKAISRAQGARDVAKGALEALRQEMHLLEERLDGALERQGQEGGGEREGRQLQGEAAQPQQEPQQEPQQPGDGDAAAAPAASQPPALQVQVLELALQEAQSRLADAQAVVAAQEAAYELAVRARAALSKPLKLSNSLKLASDGDGDGDGDDDDGEEGEGEGKAAAAAAAAAAAGAAAWAAAAAEDGPGSASERAAGDVQPGGPKTPLLLHVALAGGGGGGGAAPSGLPPNLAQYSQAAAAALREGISAGPGMEGEEKTSLSLSVHGRRVEADLDLEEGAGLGGAGEGAGRLARAGRGGCAWRACMGGCVGGCAPGLCAG